jgi:argininosuccinate lyase
MAMWGGRFGEAADPLFRRFNDSLRIDARLVRQDIAGSIAWAEAIERVGVLTSDERSRLVAALRFLDAEVTATPEMVARDADEDVHGWVERKLVEQLGDLGKKLHTGRSRNDQVATDLRLWVREEIGVRREELRAVRKALLDAAERDKTAVLPGMTHLQPAQPVLFAHWCLAYVEMLERDDERLNDANARVNRCPLGSGALAGTAYAIDRTALAKALGFTEPTRNSLDAVSDRDFVLETLWASATCAIHISRLAEDLIIMASEPFGLVTMSDRVTTGSSLMPQKKNPDALELLRGKSGRLIALPMSMAVTMKGLPLAYNKDMQEDKEPIFQAMDELSLCLRVLVVVLEGLQVRKERSAAAAARGHANATDLADVLVERGVPFRTAHEMVGKLVNRALERGVTLEAMPLEELRAVAPQLDAEALKRLTLEAVLARRNVDGGTAPAKVEAALRAARERLTRNS